MTNLDYRNGVWTRKDSDTTVKGSNLGSVTRNVANEPVYHEVDNLDYDESIVKVGREVYSRVGYSAMRVEDKDFSLELPQEALDYLAEHGGLADMIAENVRRGAVRDRGELAEALFKAVSGEIEYREAPTLGNDLDDDDEYDEDSDFDDYDDDEYDSDFDDFNVYDDDEYDEDSGFDEYEDDFDEYDDDSEYDEYDDDEDEEDSDFDEYDDDEYENSEEVNTPQVNGGVIFLEACKSFFDDMH